MCLYTTNSKDSTRSDLTNLRTHCFRWVQRQAQLFEPTISLIFIDDSQVEGFQLPFQEYHHSHYHYRSTEKPCGAGAPWVGDLEFEVEMGRRTPWPHPVHQAWRVCWGEFRGQLELGQGIEAERKREYPNHRQPWWW